MGFSLKNNVCGFSDKNVLGDLNMAYSLSRSRGFKRRYEEKKKQGICVICDNKAEPNKIMCSDCIKKKKKQYYIKKMKNEMISCDKCRKEVKRVNYTQLDLSSKSLDGEFCDNCSNEFHEIALKFGFRDIDLVISVGDLLKTNKIKTVMDLYQFICNANGDDVEIFLETYGNRKLIDKNKNVVIFS